MIRFLLATLFLFAVTVTSPAANIVIMTVEDSNNYDAVNTMRDFAEKDLRALGQTVTLIEGDQPKPNHFDGLVEAMADADLLIVFVRRRFPPKDQMAAIRAHLNAGKPLLGIRTANHAFIPKPNEVIDDSKLATWPEFTHEVLGGENTGYETKGMPYTVTVAPGAEQSPLLEGVNPTNILGHQSLYQVLPLAANATPLLIGTAEVDTTPPQPIAWTRTHGSKQARIFYTSLGAPDDMKIKDVRRLLLNGVAWAVEESKVGDAKRGTHASDLMTKVFSVPPDFARSVRAPNQDDPFASVKSGNEPEVLGGMQWPKGFGCVIDQKANLLAVRAPPALMASIEASVAAFTNASTYNSGPTISYDEFTFAVSPLKSAGTFREGKYLLPKTFSTENLEDELKNQGVPFPEGSAAEFDSASHTAMVRNTAPNMDLTVMYFAMVWEQSKEIPPFQDKAPLPQQIERGVVDQTLRDLAAGLAAAK